MKANSIGKNIFHLFYSTALSSVLNAISLILLASYLSSYNYGLFSVALAFSMIMGYFTDAGFSKIVLREGSKKEADIPSVIASFIKIRIGLFATTLLIGVLLINMIYSGNDSLVAASYYLVIPLVLGVTLQSISTTYFQLLEKMQYSGLIRIVSSVFLVVMIVIGKIIIVEPMTIFFLYGFSYLLAGCYGMYLMKKSVVISMRKPFYKGLWKHWWSFMLTGLLFIILPHLGPIVLEKTLTLQEIGYFAVAYRIPQALQQIPFIVAGAYYPVLFRLFNNHQLKEQLNMTITQIKIMALFGIAMAIPLYHLSEIIIGVLFGERWMEASSLLQVLSLILVLQAVNIALGDGLTTRALQSKRLGIQAVGVAAGIVFYSVFSNKYGLTGAVYASVLIELLLLAGFWIYIPDRLEIAMKSVVPYLMLFFISLFVVDYFLSFNGFLAAFIHAGILMVMVLFDKELKGKAEIMAKRTGLYQKLRLKRSKGVENGL